MYCYLWEGLFQTKYNLESLVNLLEVGYFECFDESFIMQHWDEQYEMKGNLQGVEELENL
jgi:hypothetical protein